jgi:hypothetical protein
MVWFINTLIFSTIVVIITISLQSNPEKDLVKSPGLLVSVPQAELEPASYGLEEG